MKTRMTLPRRLALAVLLAPFFLFSLLADGVMPMRTAQGLLIVICTGAETTEIRIDPATGAPIEDDQPGDRPCDWSGAHPPAALTPAPLPAPRLATATPAHPAPVPMRLAMARATGLPPSTGPPLLS